MIEKTRVCLLGNHDQGALFDPEGFNTGAERAIFWTRDQLENSARRPRLDRPPLGFSGRPAAHAIATSTWLYVHGSPRNPVNEYVFPGRHLQPEEDGEAVQPGAQSAASRDTRTCRACSPRAATS